MRYCEELSFVCCFAHILNLIVKKFLAILKTNDITADYEIVADLKNNLLIIQSQSAFSCIQILVLYISATSEQKKKWRNLCHIKEMNAKLIQYDIANH